MAVSTIVTGQFVRISQTPASIGERLLAYLIDVVVMILYWFSAFAIMEQSTSSVNSDLYTAFCFLVYSVPVFYPLLGEVFYRGQTVGKLLLNIRVVKADGTTPSVSAYLLRWMIFPIDFFIITGAGVISILVTRNNQRLGDLAAGTLVIKEKNYKRIQVSLDEFDFLTKDYRPVYPQAADLSLEQVNLISRILTTDKDRWQRMEQLAAKIRSSLSITTVDTFSERFLETLLRDYQYYALEEI